MVEFMSCFSGVKVVRVRVGRKIETIALICPKIHGGGSKCTCTDADTFAYNKKFGRIKKNVKLVVK